MEYLQLQLRIVFGATLRNRMTGTLCGAAGASRSCFGDRVSWHQLICRPFQHIYWPSNNNFHVEYNQFWQGKNMGKNAHDICKKKHTKNLQHKHYKCHRNGVLYNRIILRRPAEESWRAGRGSQGGVIFPLVEVGSFVVYPSLFTFVLIYVICVFLHPRIPGGGKKTDFWRVSSTI